MMHEELKKGAWTPEEDLLLKRLVDQLGPARWSIVAERIPGRSGKSCRLRWHNHLSPAVKKAPFSEYEDAVILKAHDIHGNKWSVIAKLLPGRTDNAVKNRWNSTLKRKAGTQGLRNRFLAKGVTLEMLLTQYAHHAHDNATPAMGAHGRGAAGSPSECSDSGSEDGEGTAPSGTPTGGDGSTGSGGSDDEGSSPSMQARMRGQPSAAMRPAVAYSAGGYGYGAAAAGTYGSYPGASHPHQPQLRVKTRLSIGSVRCAGAAFGEEDDCCDTFDIHAAGAGASIVSPQVHATGVSPYPPRCIPGMDNADTIQSLLDEFAAAGAAAAAAATAASLGALDDLCGSGADAEAPGGAAPGGAWRPPPGPDGPSKRDLVSSLAGAADGAASPLKRLRIGGGNPCFGSSVDEDDELPICYADQRAAGSLGGVSTAAAAVAVRRQHSEQAPAAVHEWGAAAAAAPAPVVPPVAPPAAPADGAAPTPGAGGALELLDALPCSIRTCLADAAGLYLANDASGLAA